MAQERKARKQQIAAFMASVDTMIVGRIFHCFIRKAWETVEFKDSLEYHVEKVQTALKRACFSEFIEILRRQNLNETIALQLEARHRRNNFKKR